MLYGVKIVVPEFLQINLHVGLHQAAVARVPSIVVVAPTHISHLQKIIAIVHQNGIEGGGVEMLELFGLKSKHHIEHLSLFSFKHFNRSRCGNFRCRNIRFHQFWGKLQRALIRTRLCAGLTHYHHFASLNRALKAVFIFHNHQIAFQSHHAAAAHIIQKANHIIYLHHNI